MWQPIGGSVYSLAQTSVLDGWMKLLPGLQDHGAGMMARLRANPVPLWPLWFQYRKIGANTATLYATEIAAFENWANSACAAGAQDLINIIQSNTLTPDLIVVPDSSIYTPYILGLLATAQRTWPAVPFVDNSIVSKKSRQIQASGGSATAALVRSNLQVIGILPRKTTYSHVLVLDDLLSEGKTVDAMLDVLKSNGLTYSAVSVGVFLDGRK